MSNGNHWLSYRNVAQRAYSCHAKQFLINKKALLWGLCIEAGSFSNMYQELQTCGSKIGDGEITVSSDFLLLLCVACDRSVLNRVHVYRVSLVIPFFL
jgi:hypothetical protein